MPDELRWVGEFTVEHGILGVIALSFLVLSIAAVYAARGYTQGKYAEIERAKTDGKRADADLKKAEALIVERTTEQTIVTSIQSVVDANAVQMGNVAGVLNELVKTLAAQRDTMSHEHKTQTASLDVIDTTTKKGVEIAKQVHDQIKSMNDSLVGQMDNLHQAVMQITERLNDLKSETNGDEMGAAVTKIEALLHEFTALINSCEKRIEDKVVEAKRATQEQETPVVTASNVRAASHRWSVGDGEIVAGVDIGTSIDVTFPEPNPEPEEKPDGNTDNQTT